jgi:hypothetical protein
VSQTESALVEVAREGYLPNRANAATQLAFDLGAELTPISLDLNVPDLSYGDWENLGRIVGFVGNAWQWWVGDWLNFGEALFGEDAAQAVEAVPADRYDLARRITGKDQATLQNIRSVCSRVPKDRRRAELYFTHHAKVSSLEPDEQVRWLQRAIDESWTAHELADAIRESNSPPPQDALFDGTPGGGDGGMSLSDRRDEVLTLVYRQSQPLTDGDYRLPSEVYSQVGAVLGEA